MGEQPVLGRSLVLMRTVGGYETVLKEPTWFFSFFKNSSFQDLGRVSKFAKTKISPRFQSAGSQTCDTNQFSKPVFTYQLLQFLLSQKLIFNVQK